MKVAKTTKCCSNCRNLRRNDINNESVSSAEMFRKLHMTCRGVSDINKQHDCAGFERLIKCA